MIIIIFPLNDRINGYLQIKTIDLSIKCKKDDCYKLE